MRQIERLLRKRRGGIFVLLVLLPVLASAAWIAREAWQQHLNGVLIAAIKRNDVPTVSDVLKQGASADALDKPNSPTTFKGALDGLVQRFKRNPPEERRSTYATALLVATEWQYEDFRHHGMVATHVPSKASPTSAAIVKALLEAGARTEVQNAEGCTPLTIAAWQGKHENVGLLLQYGARTNVTTMRDGWSPLMLAGVECDADTVRLLLAAHADINYRAPDGLTALGIAKAHDGKKAVRLLIQAGAKE